VPAEQVGLLVNGASRRGAQAYEPVRRALASRGRTPVFAELVKDPTQLRTVAERAVAGCRLLLVGGGDGTLSAVAGLIAALPAERRPVLGVLPLGTANDFARTLDLPADLDGAVAAVFTGKVVDIDLGWADTRPFLNVASLGLSVASTAMLGPRLKRVLGPVAYPVSALLAYHRHVAFDVRLEFPEGDAEALELDDLLQVAVGNGRYYGGGQTIAPDAGIDDHALDVYAIRMGRLRDHVSVARLLKDGTLIDHEDVRHLVTRTMRVITPEPTPVNLDGEVAARTPVTFAVQRNAIEVVVPAHVTHLRHDAAARLAARNSG